MNAEKIKQLIETFLSRLGISHERIDVRGTEEHPVFTIKTQEAGRLIGPHGGTLAALRFLVRRVAERENENTPLHFTLDVNDYEAQRIERLKEAVRKEANKVRTFKHDVELPPMSSYERRIVHDLFADEKDIATHSTGDGRFRHVVLSYTYAQNSANSPVALSSDAEE